MGDLAVKIVLKSENFGEDELALMLVVAVRIFGGDCEKPAAESTPQLIPQQGKTKHNRKTH